jgi:hypothetical protein
MKKKRAGALRSLRDQKQKAAPKSGSNGCGI